MRLLLTYTICGRGGGGPKKSDLLVTIYIVYPVHRSLLESLTVPHYLVLVQYSSSVLDPYMCRHQVKRVFLFRFF